MSRKNKKEVTEETAVKEQTPYEMGQTGSIDDLYAADRVIKADIEAKQISFRKSEKRLALFPFRSWDNHWALRDALVEAKYTPFNIREQFHKGACDAFDKRPDNIQDILSTPPGEFSRYKWGDEYLVRDTLITLLDKSANPETVLDKALAKVAEGDRQGIIDSALDRVVYFASIDINKPVSALLDAGAGVSSETLAAALHQNASVEVTDRLIEKGANIDEALQIMRDNHGYYGNLPYELVALQQAAKIHELERKLVETKKDVTAAPVKLNTISPAPARTAGTPLRMATK